MTNYSYDRRSAGLSGEVDWVSGNVISQTGVRKAITAFLKTIIQEGNEVHDLFAKELEQARKGVSGGDRISDRAVESAVFKVVEHTFGSDPLAKALAKAIAHGDYLT